MTRCRCLHHCGGQRDADAVSRRHEFAVHHRAAQHHRLRRAHEDRRRRRRRTSCRRCCARSLTWADLVVLTGGLGPTADDITRDAVARVLELPFDEDEATVARIRERFTRRGMMMQEINRRQAHGAARGATLLENPNGTAPGLWLEHGKTAIVLLPGPPREMKPMFEAVVRDRLARESGGSGPVPPRAEDHRPARVGRRRDGAADLRPLARRRKCRSARRSWRSWARSNCT